MKIVLVATTDLAFDQRLQRISNSLVNAGFEVLLVGRIKPDSPAFSPTQFKSHRLKTWFWKGKLFYVEFNVRLFFYLLNTKFDVVTANDADTLLAAFFAAKLKGKKLAFDAHEYFSEVPELLGRHGVKKVWQWIENTFIPKVNVAYTPGPSLAKLFSGKYGIPFGVVRNMPWQSESKPARSIPDSTHFNIIYSGAVNLGRGLFELIEASEGLPVRIAIAGAGDVLEELKVFAVGKKVEVAFLGYLQPQELRLQIEQADIGVNLLTTDSLSYQYSLANKFFDYVKAGIPQICVNYPEYRTLNQEFEVALLVNNDVMAIRQAVQKLINLTDVYEKLTQNCVEAAKVWHWDNEQHALWNCYKAVLHQKN
jgi:glycosyltransferase involved in cell wall biosynthesis